MKARNYAKKMLEIMSTTEMKILPGQLAFFSVMSLIPLIALIKIISTKVGVPINEFDISSSVPTDAIKIFNNISTSNGVDFNLLAFFILGFILASNGAHSMIVTSNEIYKIESRPYFYRKIKSILMTFVFVFLLLFLFFLPVFGDSIFEIFKNTIENKSIINIITNLYLLLKYPVMIMFLYFNIKLIYTLSPDKKIEHKSTTAGALFTTIGWIISSEIYSLYTLYFVKYDVFYGSISSLLVLLIWIYILSYIFSLGLIINATKNFMLDLSKIEK